MTASPPPATFAIYTTLSPACILLMDSLLPSLPHKTDDRLTSFDWDDPSYLLENPHFNIHIVYDMTRRPNSEPKFGRVWFDWYVHLTRFRVRSHICHHLNYWLRCRPTLSRDIAIQIE